MSDTDTLTCAMLGHHDVVAEHRGAPIVLCVECGRVNTDSCDTPNDPGMVGYLIRALLVVVALLLIAGTLVMLAPSADAMSRCPTEDSTGPCHWNAQTQGNHQGHSLTNYRHHRSVTGEVALSLRAVRRVERIVHRLPVCTPHTNHWTTNCREFVGHRHTLASFHTDRHTWFVGLVRGHLDYVEVHG